MKRGKSLKIFMMDGISNGRWMCELSNWTGKAYKIPKTYYRLCIDRNELRSPSIYFLFGHDDNSGQPVVYIGETEDAIKRLGEHIQAVKKDYWTEAVVFINKDDHLNKAHIKYLESRFFEIANEVGRYLIMNSQFPKKSSISEAEEAEMEEFIDNAKIIVSALGHRVFDMLVPVNMKSATFDAEEIQTEYLYIKNRNGISAKGFQGAEGFVVCKDSIIRNQISEKSHSFTRDVLFTSPSAASDFILGNSTSGPVMWKNADGITLKELLEKENMNS